MGQINQTSNQSTVVLRADSAAHGHPDGQQAPSENRSVGFDLLDEHIKKEPFGAGANSTTYRVEQDGNIYVLKRYASTFLGRIQAQNERAVLTKLAQTGAPVPRIEQTGRTEDGRPLLLMTLIPGKTHGPRFPQRTELRRDLEHALGEAHKIDASSFLELNTAGLNWSNWVSGFVRHASEHAKGVISEHVIEFVNQHVDDNRELLGNVAPKLLHGDVQGGNVLVQNGRLMGLIDWADAMPGDPAWDLARLGAFDKRISTPAAGIDYGLLQLFARVAQLNSPTMPSSTHLAVLYADQLDHVLEAHGVASWRREVSPTTTDLISLRCSTRN